MSSTCTFQSKIRKIGKTIIGKHDQLINPDLNKEEMDTGIRMGMDSHADTTCVNKHAYIESVIEGITVDAIPFDSSMGKMSDLPVVNAIYAYDDPDSLQTILLRFNNSIYIKDMKNALLCPNQARENGIIINDVPIHLDHTNQSTFSIIAGEDEMRLEQFGPTAFIRLRRPTEIELESQSPIDITGEDEWIPYENKSLQHNFSSLRSFVSNEIDNWLLEYPDQSICAINMSKPKGSLTPEYLAQLWKCGLEMAKRTIEATTCRHYRHTSRGITKRFKPTRDFMRYRQIRIPAGEFFTDTMMSKIRSVRGYTCAQIYGNKFGYIKAYPMESHNKSHLGDTLTLIIQDVGVMQKLHTDNAPEMMGRKTPFFRRARKEGIDLTTIEPLRPDENYGEILVKRAKIMSGKLMVSKNVPLRLWCYALEYSCELSSLMVPNQYRNKGRSGYEIVFGFTPDISEYVEFEFYDYCWYWDTPQSYPHEKKQIGRWLGIAHRVGQSMVYYIMNANGSVIARSTVIPLDPSDHDVIENKHRMREIDATITERIGDYRNATHLNRIDIPEMDDEDIKAQLAFTFDLKESDINDDDPEHEAASDPHRPNMDEAPNHDVNSEAFDKFLGIYVEIPSDDGESKVLGRVKNRKRDHDGVMIGKSHDNPILNTAVYNIETIDGNLHEYTANVIAQNLWNKVDDDGYNYNCLYEIIGHRRNDDAIPKSEGFYETSNGVKRKVITTRGWDFNVKWESGETSFIALKDIKEHNPVEIAEYVIANKLEKEPAFAWWVRTAIKQRNVMVAKMAKRVRKRMKFGIDLPTTYEEAVAFDKQNGNTLWQDATKKEMKNVEIAFKFLDDGSKLPLGFKKITCHLIFDVKFDLTRKARYVGGGHLTKVSPSLSYSSVVSRDSVRIMFLIAALNDLDIKMCDIGNAYLNAETRERLWFIAGKEWGSRAGCEVIIVRALYGLKSSGAEWKKTFASYIRNTLGYSPCIGADDNVYLRLEKNEFGEEYYSYLVVYVDDVLSIHKDPDKVLNIVNRDYRLKEPPECPTMYLGADISKYEVHDETTRTTCWAMSADSHVKKALEVVQMRLNADDVYLKGSKKAPEHPFSSQSYRPELDTTELCNDEQVQLYQSLIGIMTWLCEIGRIDILTEKSLLATYLASPRLGHLHQALHVFKYLKQHGRSKCVFDPTYVNINDHHLPFEEQSATRAKFMKELYPDAVEYRPQNAPKPKGKKVQLTCFVDADHAGDQITRRSRTGILIYVNRAPIMWYSKRQNTVETSTYGSELVAMRLAVDMIKALKYKLWMFGVEIMMNETKIYGDNNAVILNASIPESTLKKKHHSVNYNYVREAVAAGITLIFKVDTGSNLADLFTKLLDRVKRKEIIQKILR